MHDELSLGRLPELLDPRLDTLERAPPGAARFLRLGRRAEPEVEGLG